MKHQKWKRRSKQEWLEIVDRQRASGLYATTFCEQESLEYRSFCRWRRHFYGTRDTFRASKDPQINHYRESVQVNIDLPALIEMAEMGKKVSINLGNGVEMRLGLVA
jgi:hypothetical protein